MIYKTSPTGVGNDEEQHKVAVERNKAASSGGRRELHSPVYLYIWMVRGGGQVEDILLLFCHSTKNVHGNHKQTSE